MKRPSIKAIIISTTTLALIGTAGYALTHRQEVSMTSNGTNAHIVTVTKPEALPALEDVAQPVGQVVETPAASETPVANTPATTTPATPSASVPSGTRASNDVLILPDMPAPDVSSNPNQTILPPGSL